MRSIWKKYRRRVYNNILGESENNVVSYWRNKMFAGMLVYLLPLILLAVIPRAYWSFKKHVEILFLLDILLVCILVYITLFKNVKVSLRKQILIGVGYIMSVVIIYLMGISGPGPIFIYTCCVFGIALFESKYAYLFAWLNTSICVVICSLMFFNISPDIYSSAASITDWIILFATIIFISFLSAALIPGVFKGLQQSITEQALLTKQLEEKKKSLEKTNKLLKTKNEDLEQFTHIASHDLREPLRMVTSFLGQLQKKYDPVLDEKGRTYIYYAVTGARRMHTIIGDLLEFSKAGRTDEMPKAVNTKEIINSVLLVLKNKISEKNARVTIDSMPVVNAHPSLLHQVFQNLIDNSLKYPKKDSPPTINISAQHYPLYWQFTVSDDGIGISPEYHERIFFIFQRLHSEEDYDGTGIGLAICKKTIEMLNGRIWVESEENRGARFHFTLPHDAEKKR